MACGGSLSDEQRKKMREEMNLHKIKKITEAQIMDAAYTHGRNVMKTVERIEHSPAAMDSLRRVSHSRITWLDVNAKNAGAMETQLIEAYITGVATGTLEDNVQKIRNADGETDSILYTKPVVREMSDGSVTLYGTWNIAISQKDLILSMTKK